MEQNVKDNTTFHDVTEIIYQFHHSTYIEDKHNPDKIGGIHKGRGKGRAKGKGRFFKPTFYVYNGNTGKSGKGKNNPSKGKSYGKGKYNSGKSKGKGGKFYKPNYGYAGSGNFNKQNKGKGKSRPYSGNINKGKGRGSYSPSCSICGKSGHTADTCWYAPTSPPSTNAVQHHHHPHQSASSCASTPATTASLGSGTQYYSMNLSAQPGVTHLPPDGISYGNAGIQSINGLDYKSIDINAVHIYKTSPQELREHWAVMVDTGAAISVAPEMFHYNRSTRK